MYNQLANCIGLLDWSAPWNNNLAISTECIYTEVNLVVMKCIWYRILPKNLSPYVSRNIQHLVAIRIGMNKMAADDKYLEYISKSLEQIAKRWSTFVRGVPWWNGGVWTHHSDSGSWFSRVQRLLDANRGPTSSAIKNKTMNMTGMLWQCAEKRQCVWGRNIGTYFLSGALLE